MEHNHIKQFTEQWQEIIRIGGLAKAIEFQKTLPIHGMVSFESRKVKECHRYKSIYTNKERKELEFVFKGERLSLGQGNQFNKQLERYNAAVNEERLNKENSAKINNLKKELFSLIMADVSDTIAAVIDEVFENKKGTPSGVPPVGQETPHVVTHENKK